MSAPVDELRSWNVEQLWDALTLYRHVEYKPEAREMLANGCRISGWSW